MKNIPASKPKKTVLELTEMIKAAHPDFVFPYFFICGIRGYYLDTMGAAGKNDRMIYDDAIFLIGKNDFQPFNANVDPSAFKPNIANLVPGIYPVYKFDLHKGKYLAICQRNGNVTVMRDGGKLDTGMFGINIHKGGNNTTSSLGCQTLPPPQWPDFITTAQSLAKKYYGDNWKKLTYTYVLLEN